MATTINPIAEGITAGQIGKINELLAAGLRKHGSTISSAATQEVLREEGAELVKELVEAIRSRVERHSEMIVRHVVINPKLTPKQVVDATGRTQYISDDVLATMPDSYGPDEDDVYFFSGKRSMSAEEVEKEFDRRGLVPCPRKQAQANTDDPSFADQHPNGTQWNREGKVSSFLAFSRWGDERDVHCDRRDGGWRGYWWFAGVRKVSE